jgi:hypothetical protein
VRADAITARDGPAWVETRGKTALIWSPLPGAEDWKDLMGINP